MQIHDRTEGEGGGGGGGGGDDDSDDGWGESEPITVEAADDMMTAVAKGDLIALVQLSTEFDATRKILRPRPGLDAVGWEPVGGSGVADADDMGLVNLAVKTHQLEMLEFLIDSGLPLGAQCPTSGFSPLHIAVAYANRPGLLLLLDTGAPVDLAMRTGLTPLHMAIGMGDHVSAKLLLDGGASVTASCNRDENAWHKAASISDPTALSLLLTAATAAGPPPPVAEDGRQEQHEREGKGGGGGGGGGEEEEEARRAEAAAAREEALAATNGEGLTPVEVAQRVRERAVAAAAPSSSEGKDGGEDGGGGADGGGNWETPTGEEAVTLAVDCLAVLEQAAALPSSGQ